MRLPKSPAAKFVGSPRFRIACERYGLREEDLSSSWEQLYVPSAGRRQYVVHAVDLARRALLSSWLVCAVNRLPAVSKALSCTVPAALGAKKSTAARDSNPGHRSLIHVL